MPIPLENHVVCVTESELMQWVSRGRIHLLMDRILLPSEPRDGSLFAACSALKVDDAKARVLVSLKPQWLVAEHFHPTFRSRKIFSLPISMVSELAPPLPQYRRRLDVFKLKISDWSAEEEWDNWLVDQSSHERVSALRDIASSSGLESPIFNGSTSTLDEIIRLVMRPNSHKIGLSEIPGDWIQIVAKRDQILGTLRFEGHSDRTSFFSASLRQIALHCYERAIAQAIELLPADRGWVRADLPNNLIEAVSKLLPDDISENLSGKSLLLGSIYLRCFDELNYGAEDWTIVEDLVQLVRTLVDGSQADLLALSLISAYSPDKLRALNIRPLF